MKVIAKEYIRKSFLRIVHFRSNEFIFISIISSYPDFHASDPTLGGILPGDVQLKEYRPGQKLYKARPLFEKQKFMSIYMKPGAGDCFPYKNVIFH